MKVWDRAGIQLATPGSAVRHASVAKHLTDCTMRPGIPACVMFVCIFVSIPLGAIGWSVGVTFSGQTHLFVFFNC